MGSLDIRHNKNILTDIKKSEDAGIYKIDDNLALVQTLDFLTPIVNSPFEFGMIAAANALSDVYAMGGEPLTAMNIVCFPSSTLDKEILKETLAGGLKKIDEAGAFLVGGHSVDDDEFKYGLSVTGKIHPKKILRNSGAKTSDIIILTKPLGTGIISTVIKGGLAEKSDVDALVMASASLNKYAASIIKDYKISSCTDVTGFGLLGHLVEMANSSNKTFLIDLKNIELIGKTKEYAKSGLIPAGAYKNRDFCKNSVKKKSNVEQSLIDIAYDPQTSGGLLFTIDKKNAKECFEKLKGQGINSSIVGEVGGDNIKGVIEI